MPGPVSDSYDPEFGTAETAREIKAELQRMYLQVSVALNGAPPRNIVELVRSKPTHNLIDRKMDERDWRLLRFALERAIESL